MGRPCHWDATGEPGAADRVRRSGAFDAWLRGLGFAPLGVLASEHGGFDAILHPELTHGRLAVWRSADGAVTAEVDHLYGVDTVELHTLLDDGTSLLTWWSSRPGGVPFGWYRGDPRCAPPRGLAVWLQQGRGIRRSLLSFGLSAGQRRRRVDGPDVAAALAAHRAWIDEHREHGPVVPLDVAGLAALTDHVHDSWAASLPSAAEPVARTGSALAVVLGALTAGVVVAAVEGGAGPSSFAALIGLLAGAGAASVLLAAPVLVFGAGPTGWAILLAPVVAAPFVATLAGWSFPAGPFAVGAATGFVASFAFGRWVAPRLPPLTPPPARDTRRVPAVEMLALRRDGPRMKAEEDAQRAELRRRFAELRSRQGDTGDLALGALTVAAGVALARLLPLVAPPRRPHDWCLVLFCAFLTVEHAWDHRGAPSWAVGAGTLGLLVGAAWLVRRRLPARKDALDALDAALAGDERG